MWVNIFTCWDVGSCEEPLSRCLLQHSVASADCTVCCSGEDCGVSYPTAARRTDGWLSGRCSMDSNCSFTYHSWYVGRVLPCFSPALFSFLMVSVMFIGSHQVAVEGTAVGCAGSWGCCLWNTTYSDEYIYELLYLMAIYCWIVIKPGCLPSMSNRHRRSCRFVCYDAGRKNEADDVSCVDNCDWWRSYAYNFFLECLIFPSWRTLNVLTEG